MPGKQRTFELIPTTLVNTDGPRRAMTSKAAKKAYQQRNKGPIISKAEQRRLDAEELARQNKEYERERAATKAKAAREKKSAKEQAERAERKRMGLPEPSKFVRASQPTISIFIKSGNRRTWQEIEAVSEESEGTLCEQEEAEHPSKRGAISDDTEDDFGDFPSFSQSELPELLDRVDSSSHETAMEDLASGLPAGEVHECPEDEKIDSQEMPARRLKTMENDQYPEDEDVLADMVTTQLLSEAAEAANRTQSPISRKSPDMTGITPKAGEKRRFSRASTSPKPPLVPKISHPVLQERSVNMPPPQAPTNRTKKTISFASTPPIAIYAPSKPVEPSMPPSATQAFLENHLDDFFPSPSQQVRELLDDIDDLPSNTQIAKELTPCKRVEDDQDDPFAGVISTQDLLLSPQDLLEITTPSRPPTMTFRRESPVFLRPASAGKRRFFEEKDEDLLFAALHESTVVEVDNVPEEKRSPVKGSRSLHRIQSTMTDYGDEEFNEQELLALG